MSDVQKTMGIQIMCLYICILKGETKKVLLVNTGLSAVQQKFYRALWRVSELCARVIRPTMTPTEWKAKML
jgi:hypothetical protein